MVLKGIVQLQRVLGSHKGNGAFVEGLEIVARREDTAAY